MGKIIPVSVKRDNRNKCIFKNIPVTVKTEYGNEAFPCIVLYEKTTGIPLAYPGLERWYIDLSKAEFSRLNSLKAYASGIAAFMNFLLWNTNVNTLNEVTINEVRDFLVSYKKKQDNTSRSSDGWEIARTAVFTLLTEYCKHNIDLDFSYSLDDFYEVVKAFNKDKGKTETVLVQKNLWVSAPKEKNRKNRFIPESYLSPLLLCAEKYDPMIEVGIALQAFAGLREGEVVNLTIGKIKKVYGGFGMLGRIELDLKSRAPFAEEWKGKTDFGSIKKHRIQEVYPDFVEDLVKIFDRHEKMLKDLSDNAPLLTNAWGKPMSVDTYKNRLKNLFNDYFVPYLRRACEKSGDWAENAPYVEAYEKDYPGAHALRHWFTMYLIKHIQTDRNQDPIDIISKWRGDSSREAMADYVHINADIIETFPMTNTGGWILLMIRTQESIMISSGMHLQGP